MFTCLIHLCGKSKNIYLASVHATDVLLVDVHYNRHSVSIDDQGFFFSIKTRRYSIRLYVISCYKIGIELKKIKTKNINALDFSYVILGAWISVR